jgi:hypothetical protein
VTVGPACALATSSFTKTTAQKVAQKQQRKKMVQNSQRVAGTEEGEWVQHVVSFGSSQALALDANRGLIVIDLANECYSVYQPDPSWCIQDALHISEP